MKYIMINLLRRRVGKNGVLKIRRTIACVFRQKKLSDPKLLISCSHCDRCSERERAKQTEQQKKDDQSLGLRE